MEIYNYVTKNSFDAYLFQIVESKQKFIGQIMTSKSPVRSAEDVDEQALSYAEIKALASGNPAVKEKMDLDVTVARLRLLKSSHLSQRYSMEDRLARYFPEAIRGKERQVEAVRADWEALRSVPEPPDDEISPLRLADKVYTEKEAAGAALMEACKTFAGAGTAVIGQYKSFMVDTFLDGFSQEVIVELRRQEKYRFTLGSSAQGNITRMNNTLQSIEAVLKTAEHELGNLNAQMENAKSEVERPFPQEAELTEKLARLAELNAELNLDQRESVVDGEPEEKSQTARGQER